MSIINVKELLKKLEGVHTIESVMSVLNVDKQKAIYYIYRLRKNGYVKTKRTSENKRIYHVSFENKLGGCSYIDIINKYSPLKVASSENYRIYGKSPTLEETLVYAIKSKDFRVLLASLSLFRRIKNWPELYNMAKASNIKRQIGVLYDIAKGITRVRKMARGFRNNILPKGNEKYEFIIEGLKSEDFKDIEKLWRIYIPFNKKDLEDYKKQRK